MASSIWKKRNSDYLYDKTFVVSGSKDHYKHAYYAKMGSSQNIHDYAICPVFASMFSDLPHYPRKQYIRRTINAQPLQDYQDRNLKSSSEAVAKTSIDSGADVAGVDRHRFFSHSTIALTVPKLNLDQESCTIVAEAVLKSPDNGTKMHHKKSQTIYRCSSAQTSPWQPPYHVMDSGDPELLKLDFLKWGVGLPVGKHEVTLIERARMKRRWNLAIPPVDGTKKSITENTNIIMALEREQWAFREQDIQAMQELRMELLEQMLRELLRNSKIRSEMKLRMYNNMVQAQTNEKLQKLYKKCEREKRRLKWAYTGVISKYTKGNIVDEMSNKKSEVYAPLLRNGNNPKYKHLNLTKANYKCQYIGVERFQVIPQGLQAGTKIRDNEIKLPGTRLCIRETKWTDQVLKQLHDELKGLRKSKRKKCSLRTKIDRIPDEPPTPEVDAIEDEEERIYQASLMIEAVLRGRAAQILIFEGRDRCRELIEELRRSNAVLKKEISEKFQNRQEVEIQQRNEEMCLRNINRVQEALKRLEGSVVGTLLDFLNKELIRLLDERQVHALCLMAEREREVREAAEAGKRQLEFRRRQEHDEMFKQMAKINQDTVDLYLQDIITEGMEFASSEEAKEFVHKLAVKVDILNATFEKNKNDINYQEEMVADLVHHFVLPEVEKKIVRENYKNRQAKYLRTAHEEIYRKMEKLKVDQNLHVSKITRRQPDKKYSAEILDEKLKKGGDTVDEIHTNKTIRSNMVPQISESETLFEISLSKLKINNIAVDINRDIDTNKDDVENSKNNN